MKRLYYFRQRIVADRYGTVTASSKAEAEHLIDTGCFDTIDDTKTETYEVTDQITIIPKAKYDAQ